MTLDMANMRFEEMPLSEGANETLNGSAAMAF